ncbi:hypothetical protein [Spirosoma spitsbergense]|uniref:hypothetical protein n=1 Tax=Spirosoma spitsbergense TaxID=431554 RepID=UPI00037350DA|nr:hypothetical protein [Spirosoma spitsbergense]
MSINRLLLFMFMFMSGLYLVGCSPEEPALDKKVNALHEQFHGKYKPIRSTSSEAIDVNLDGQVSADMLAEISQLRKEYGNNLEIRSYGASKYSPTPSFSFVQWWPEQYIYMGNKPWEGEPLVILPSRPT